MSFLAHGWIFLLPPPVDSKIVGNQWQDCIYTQNQLCKIQKKVLNPTGNLLHLHSHLGHLADGFVQGDLQ